MKKVLYSTTALAAAGMFAFGGADAQAAEKVKLGLSGSFTALVGVINNDAKQYDNLNSVNVVGDSEIRFSGHTTLDNGIRVDVILELETDHNQANGGAVSTKTASVPAQDSTQATSAVDSAAAPVDAVTSASGGNQSVLDESYIKISNAKAWGDFRIGTTKQAHFITGRAGMPMGNPLSNPTNPDQPTRFLPAANGLAPWNHEGGADRMLVAYYTPRINGFQAGISYTPGHANSDAPAASDGQMAADSKNTSIGANFKSKFGDASVNLAGGWTTVDGKKGKGSEYTTTQVGVSVGFAGFGLGAWWAEREDDTPMSNDDDREGVLLGVNYKTGPWTVGLNWANVTRDTDPMTPGEDQTDMTTLGISYALGAGVTAGASLIQADYENATKNKAMENQGTAVVGGIKVAF